VENEEIFSLIANPRKIERHGKKDMSKERTTSPQSWWGAGCGRIQGKEVGLSEAYLKRKDYAEKLASRRGEGTRLQCSYNAFTRA